MKIRQMIDMDFDRSGICLGRTKVMRNWRQNPDTLSTTCHPHSAAKCLLSLS